MPRFLGLQSANDNGIDRRFFVYHCDDCDTRLLFRPTHPYAAGLITYGSGVCVMCESAKQEPSKKLDQDEIEKRKATIKKRLEHNRE